MPEELEPTTEEATEEAEEVEEVEGEEGESGEESEAEEVAEDDPFSEFGGRDAVAEAVQWRGKLSEANGALEVFFQIGEAFGIPIDRIDGLFQNQAGGSDTKAAAAAEETAEEPSDDDVMTYGQFKELLDKQVLSPMQEQKTAAQRAQAQATVQSTLDELQASALPDETKLAILQLGDRYLRGSLDPKDVANAVRKGYTDYQALVKGAAPKTPAPVKRAPKPVSGSGGGTQPPAEPKDVKEAIARARQRLLG